MNYFICKITHSIKEVPTMSNNTQSVEEHDHMEEVQSGENHFMIQTLGQAFSKSYYDNLLPNSFRGDFFQRPSRLGQDEPQKGQFLFRLSSTQEKFLQCIINHWVWSECLEIMLEPPPIKWPFPSTRNLAAKESFHYPPHGHLDTLMSLLKSSSCINQVASLLSHAIHIIEFISHIPISWSLEEWTWKIKVQPCLEPPESPKSIGTHTYIHQSFHFIHHSMCSISTRWYSPKNLFHQTIWWCYSSMNPLNFSPQAEVALKSPV